MHPVFIGKFGLLIHIAFMVFAMVGIAVIGFMVWGHHMFTTGQSAYANLARNRTALGNVVFRPKTYLLFSAEYRRIQSWPIYGSANTAPALGLAAGYLF